MHEKTGKIEHLIPIIEIVSASGFYSEDVVSFHVMIISIITVYCTLGPPDPLVNCTQMNATSSSIALKCFEGTWDGGLRPLSFFAQVSLLSIT